MDQVTPHKLDPSLKAYQDMFALGNGEATGFYAGKDLVTKRQIALFERSNMVKEGHSASHQSGRDRGQKRALQDSSASSTASNPNDRGGGQSSSQTGGRLSYENDHQELLSHDNDIKKIRSILSYRFTSSGRSVTGTVIKNDSHPLTILTTLAQRGNSEAKCNRLYNLKGSPHDTMIYSKLLEDSAVYPFEFKTYCEQCHDHHTVHKMVPLKIIFVTENGELFIGATSLMGALKNPSFKNLLLKESILPCQVVNIEFVDIRDGGVFANNLTWLTALIERECMAQCTMRKKMNLIFNF